ncbi:DUF2214 domain-containing protein [Paracoccus sp. S1E-3]|nr:DUF2214 domain-containing protein [Paracoccus sp. S1E-3]MBA4490870.1 DUF2214 domain-containing protein [Paracoccus sp. S1E-3]
MRRSALLYALVNATHILGIGLILGAILPLDLRIQGLLRAPPLAVIGPFLSRVAAVGVGLAMLTGLALISVRPGEYLGNPAFRVKVLLLVTALLNVAALHLSGTWGRAAAGGVVSVGLRLGAAVSFSAWLGALVAGRMIGFL